MSNLTIIHNSRCSKSRQTLELLQEKGVEPTIIEYLKTPLTSNELASIAKKLTTPLNTMVRTKEDEYKSSPFDIDNLNTVIEALVEIPKLLERPIVYNESKAIIGRPPENVLELLS